jgi:hypothetical protein
MREQPMGIRKEFLRKTVPLIICLSTCLFASALINFSAIYRHRGVTNVMLMDKTGWDLGWFYAAGRFPSRVDSNRYLSLQVPPFLATVHRPLTYFPFRTAYTIVFTLIFLSIIATFFLSAVMFLKARWGELAVLGLLLLLIMGSSYPVLDLLDRGNVDWLTLALVWLSLWLGYKRKQELLAGVVLGLACGIKIYPLLLLVPIVLLRRYKTGVGALLSLLCIVASRPYRWSFYIHSGLLERMGRAGIFENCSLENFFECFSRLFVPKFFGFSRAVPGFSFGVFITIIAVIAWGINKIHKRLDDRDTLASFLLFIPLMVAIPSMVYSYEMVHLLPLIPFYCSYWGESDKNGWIVAGSIGVGLSQFQSIAMGQLLDGIVRPAVIHGISSLGLLMVIGSGVWFVLLCVERAVSSPLTVYVPQENLLEEKKEARKVDFNL